MINAVFGQAVFGDIVFGDEYSIAPPLPAPADRTFLISNNKLEEYISYKTSNEIENYTFDWSEVLGASNFIASSLWTIETNEISIVNSGIDIEENTTTVEISGGVCDGLTSSIYFVTNRITTTSGLVFEATFRLYVKKYNL